MRSFNHFNPKKLEHKYKNKLFIIIFPSYLCAIAAVIMTLFTLGSSETFTSVSISAFVIIITVAISISIGIYFHYYNASRRACRFTFADIFDCNAVFSIYEGEFRQGACLVVCRTLIVLDYNEKYSFSISDENKLLIEGKIRIYRGYSDELNYKIEYGRLEFVHPWLNDNGFDISFRAEIPDVFTSKRGLIQRLYAAQNRFLTKPKEMGGFINTLPKKIKTIKRRGFE